MVVLSLLFGCAPDVARLETEEAALTREVEVLRRNVEEMRSQMEEMGLRPAGPTSGASDLGGSGEDLDGAIPVTVTRTGTPPQFPDLGEPERRKNTDCGWRFSIPWLEALSDQKLAEIGAGRASPLELSQGGRPLEAHANPNGAEKSCRFAFSHRPKFLFFTPASTVDNVSGTFEMSLSADVPMKSGEADVFWVYPGTTLVVSLGQGWDAEAWGAPSVRLDARNLYVGTPEAPNQATGSPSVVTFAGKEFSSRELQLGVDEPLEAPENAWTIEVSSPTDGPYVFVRSLAVASATHRRVVVTAPRGKAQ